MHVIANPRDLSAPKPLSATVVMIPVVDTFRIREWSAM